ncbi:hypothetical protein FRC11_014235, partial [Ceratobasidium sp. 423]
MALKLNALTEFIAKLGSAAGLILFMALMIKFFIQLMAKPDRTANQKAMSFVQILIILVTLIVIAPGDKAKLNCFIISGSKVPEGVGQYVIIAIGPKLSNSRIMVALSGDTESTPLQLKLNALAEFIAKLGSAAGLILFTALMIEFFVQLKTKPDRTANQKAMSFIQILIISVTLTVIAVPEGLPLAVTPTLAFATKCMTKECLLAHVLRSCETMANASIVCTNKTGTLTQNIMSAVAGSISIHCKFVWCLSENKGHQHVDCVVEDQEVGSECNHSHKDDFPLEMAELNKVIHKPLHSLFNEALAVNSTAFENKDPKTGQFEFVGSKTETALLRFAKDLKWAPYQHTRSSADIIQMIPFSSERRLWVLWFAFHLAVTGSISRVPQRSLPSCVLVMSLFVTL